jgi:hypothetical protein
MKARLIKRRFRHSAQVQNAISASSKGCSGLIGSYL